MNIGVSTSTMEARKSRHSRFLSSRAHAQSFHFRELCITCDRDIASEVLYESKVFPHVGPKTCGLGRLEIQLHKPDAFLYVALHKTSYFISDFVVRRDWTKHVSVAKTIEPGGVY